MRVCVSPHARSHFHPLPCWLALLLGIIVAPKPAPGIFSVSRALHCPTVAYIGHKKPILKQVNYFLQGESCSWPLVAVGSLVALRLQL